jgi:hypothetical protein
VFHSSAQVLRARISVNVMAPSFSFAIRRCRSFSCLFRYEMANLRSCSPSSCKPRTNLKNAVFWDLAPCTSCVIRRFGGTYCLHLQGKKIRERRASVSRWLHTRTSRRHMAFFIVTVVKTSNLTGTNLFETLTFTSNEFHKPTFIPWKYPSLLLGY